jgi:Aldo/keto reductase family
MNVPMTLHFYCHPHWFVHASAKGWRSALWTWSNGRRTSKEAERHSTIARRDPHAADWFWHVQGRQRRRYPVSPPGHAVHQTDSMHFQPYMHRWHREPACDMAWRISLCFLARRALEAGYRHLDCAPVYDNEALVGEAIKPWIQQHGRNSLFITSKVWNDAHRPNLLRCVCTRKCNAALQYPAHCIHADMSAYSAIVCKRWCDQYPLHRVSCDFIG